MHKKIIFSFLLIAHPTVHGMEIPASAISLEMVLRNSDNAWTVTEHLRKQHKPNINNLKENIRALYETNKFFHEYYGQEKVMQKIITGCASDYYSNSYSLIIKKLGCHTVQKKIDHLCTIIRQKYKPFTAKDLQDPWYFSIVLGNNDQSLLYAIINNNNLQFKKAHTVITHAQKIDFGWHTSNYLLKLIAESRRAISDENTRNELLCITERLLREKNMPADGTFLPLTALMYASSNNDKPLAHLLLQYGANPYKKRDGWCGKNSFEFEEGEPKGWLKRMATTNNLFKYWSFKNYTDTTLPQKTMQSIMRTVQQLHYHYDTQKDRLFNIIEKRNTIKKLVKNNAVSEFLKNNSTFHIKDGIECWSSPSSYKIDFNGLLENNTEFNDLFNKAHRLLQKGLRPNFRQKNTEQTSLISAVKYQDQQLTQLLLEYDADPYIKSYNSFTKKMENAFDFAGQQMWFKKMVNEFEIKKEATPKYLLLKNYTIEGCDTLPQEIALLIMHMYVNHKNLQEAQEPIGESLSNN